MAAQLGSKLAQLANARKQAAEVAALTPEDLERIEAEKATAHLDSLHQLLLPHVEEFNGAVDASMKIKLEVTFPLLRIKQDALPLLTLEVTSKSARFRRKSSAYAANDYFTIAPAADGTMTFARFSAAVEKPFGPNQFAEHVLMEALGLNES
jgi:hypothetical protein